MVKGSKLKSEYYKKFLAGDFFEKIGNDVIEKALLNINTLNLKNREESRALLIALYYTGARPSEVLNLKGEDVVKEGNDLFVYIRTLKGGNNRKIAISLRRQFIKEFYTYVCRIYPAFFLFEHYRSGYIRTYQTGKIDSLTNPIKEVKTNEVSNKLRYYFNLWFKGVLDDHIPPYYLRHNRFTRMVEKGATIQDIVAAKGSKTEASVFPYMHTSKDRAKKISRLID